MFIFRILMTLLRSLTWTWIYWRKALIDHSPMMMIVSGYNFARKSYMKKPEQMKWLPTSLGENLKISLPKKSVPDLRDLDIIWEVIPFFDALPRPCSLVCHTFFLGMSPAGRWFPSRCAKGRGSWLSAIMSLWNFWPHFSVCRILGRPYRPYRGSHCRVKVRGVFCNNIYPPSEVCVWIFPPLSE